MSLKSEVPLDLQAVHRARQRLVAARTRLINQLRAMLLERGVILPKRRTTLRRRLETLQAPDLPLGERSRHLLDDLREEWGELDRRIAAYDDELAELARMDERAKRLTGIPGIGVVNATALVAAVGDGATFTKVPDLAAWLGLTPRQHSTGGKTRLLGVSKCHNAYLRTQLIHGARAAMAHFVKQDSPTGAWLRSLLARAHPNVAVVALAAKLARIAWATLRSGQGYVPQPG